MTNFSKINNGIYDHYGERWYTAQDDPIALLRAENRVMVPWVYNWIMKMKGGPKSVLDVGCGGGFMCNGLAERGLNVTGIDNSPESLKVASLYDKTASVKYLVADAYKLPFADESFDVVTCMDFLEHVERPREVIKECARVLRPGGKFFFHTFNRNFFSWLFVIKTVEVLVKNTPRNMHVIDLFIRPEELVAYCTDAGIEVGEMKGITPKFTSIPIRNYFSGIVPDKMEFKITSSLLLSYMGEGVKEAYD